MELQTIKLELIKMLLETEEKSILEKVRKILSPQKNGSKPVEGAVGYQPDGSPITKEQLLKRIEESEEAIRKGEIISMEDLMKESENW